METVAYMQIVPGSFKSYSCNCQPDTGGNHSLGCPQWYSPIANTWPSFKQSQVSGELCGRCWQNHTPGFVCMCGCHIKPTFGTTTTDSPYDNGDDLDAPQTT